mmetsp:Transcript_32759/g.105847  ORF Transcript_32759/g.105847 Transcript_32759/m.105847 type:complete len:274 (-) Transcript_32759:1098-1919(-)
MLVCSMYVLWALGPGASLHCPPCQESRFNVVLLMRSAKLVGARRCCFGRGLCIHLSSSGSVSRSLAAPSRLGLAREAEDLPHRLARALGAFGSLGTRALGRSHGASEPVVRRPRVRKVRCHVVGDEDGGALLGREGGVTAADDGDLSKAVVQELEHNLADESRRKTRAALLGGWVPGSEQGDGEASLVAHLAQLGPRRLARLRQTRFVGRQVTRQCEAGVAEFIRRPEIDHPPAGAGAAGRAGLQQLVGLEPRAGVRRGDGLGGCPGLGEVGG